MKKVFTKRIMYLLLLLLAISSVFALVTMIGGSVKAIPGANNVVFPVNMNNDEEVSGFQVDINYSTADLVLVGIEPTSRLSDVTIIYNNELPIVRIVVLVNDESNKISPGTGAVLNLIFNVDENAQIGDYGVDLKELIVANISAVSLDVSDNDGLFQIVKSYSFKFLPPISLNENFTLQEGATLPLRFNVSDGVNFISDESVSVRIYNLSLGIDLTFTYPENITIDEEDEFYITQIHTSLLDMPEGSYNVDVSFDNHQSEKIGFELINKSNGLAKGK